MSNLSDFSLWQLQICYQSPGLTKSLTRREGCWFWWRRQWITERTCDQRSLSLPVHHGRIRASGIPLKHDSKGGIWKELVRITVSARNGFWLRQDRYKIANVQSRSSAFRPPAPGNRCAIWQTWRPDSRHSTPHRIHKNFNMSLILDNSLLFKSLLYTLGILKKKHFQLSDKALEMRKGFQHRKSLCFVRAHL